MYDYAKTFLGKSVTTWDWKAHLYAYFEKHNKEKVKALDGVDWDVSRVSCPRSQTQVPFPGLVLRRGHGTARQDAV